MCVSGYGQQVRQFNLNNYNGLPSNNVYCIKQDRLGYLWIGTNDGIVKYNGYSFLLFDISTGLKTSDAWDLNEDNKGRMWISSIAYDFGYIQNDKYHTVYVKDYNNFIYPTYIRNHKDGIMFLSSYQNKEAIYLGIEKNDTLNMLELKTTNPSYSTYISQQGELFRSENGILYKGKRDGDKYNFTRLCEQDHDREHQMLNNSLVPYPGSGKQTISILHTEDCSTSEFTFSEGETIINQYENNNNIYLIGKEAAYVFDMQMTKGITKKFSSYMTQAQLHANRVAYITIDSFWGTCIATTKTGFFMAYNIPHFEKVVTRKISKFRHVGNDNAHKQYWWNKENRTLATIFRNNVDYIQLDSIENILKVMPSSTGDLHVFSNLHIYKLEGNNLLRIYPGLKLVKNVNVPNPDLGYVKGEGYLFEKSMTGIIDGVYKNDTLYYVRRGVGYGSYVRKNDTLIITLISDQRFKGMIYDSVYGGFIVYGDNNIILHRNEEIFKINKATLHAAGISKIESITCDQRYGNIFIKTYDKIIAYNIQDNKFGRILDNYKLENTILYNYKDLLIAAGKFGVLFCKINGPMIFSEPVLYNNVKSVAYKYLHDLFVSEQKVYLNTDSALFFAALPTDEMYTQQATSTGKYKFIVSTKTPHM